MLRTLLIVEDQHDLAELVALHLADLAQRIHVCNDGTEALRIAASEPPDLSFWTWACPALTGWRSAAVCARGRATCRY